jgi:hypothetical protein
VRPRTSASEHGRRPLARLIPVHPSAQVSDSKQCLCGRGPPPRAPEREREKFIDNQIDDCRSRETARARARKQSTVTEMEAERDRDLKNEHSTHTKYASIMRGPSFTLENLPLSPSLPPSSLSLSLSPSLPSPLLPMANAECHSFFPTLFHPFLFGQMSFSRLLCLFFKILVLVAQDYCRFLDRMNSSGLLKVHSIVNRNQN